MLLLLKRVVMKERAGAAIIFYSQSYYTAYVITALYVGRKYKTAILIGSVKAFFDSWVNRYIYNLFHFLSTMGLTSNEAVLASKALFWKPNSVEILTPTGHFQLPGAATLGLMCEPT